MIPNLQRVIIGVPSLRCPFLVLADFVWLTPSGTKIHPQRATQYSLQAFGSNTLSEDASQVFAGVESVLTLTGQSCESEFRQLVLSLF